MKEKIKTVIKIVDRIKCIKKNSIEARSFFKDLFHIHTLPIFDDLKVKIYIQRAMIVIRLRGGLGNQLFQYAAGAALAEHHGTNLKLDLYYYEKYFKSHVNRKFELPKLNIPVEIASRREVRRFTGENKIIRYLNKYSNYLHCPEVFAQPHYHFYEDFFNLPSNLYLSGYWQSEKYFSSIRSKILRWYTPVLPLDQKNLELKNDIENSNSVSLHVRRSDYSSSAIFGSVSEGYYKRAIDYVKQHVDNVNFFVFSDDIEWCRRNLMLTKATFVENNANDHAYIDILLMSYCKNHIIANSSFSWWGAWLNVNGQKIVIAPQQWFKNTYYNGKTPLYSSRLYNSKDIVPEGWIKL